MPLGIHWARPPSPPPSHLPPNAPKRPPLPQPHYAIFGTLFTVLYFLHLYWTWLILQVGAGRACVRVGGGEGVGRARRRQPRPGPALCAAGDLPAFARRAWSVERPSPFPPTLMPARPPPPPATPGPRPALPQVVWKQLSGETARDVRENDDSDDD